MKVCKYIFMHVYIFMLLFYFILFQHAEHEKSYNPSVVPLWIPKGSQTWC